MGSGGVGKTSVSAALAYAAARGGVRCALVTVDPARRLRSALGVDELSVEPRRLDVDAPGELWAMALDTKRTFDDLIERVTPSAQVARVILDNPLYRELSNELGGSTEYMAMEKLHELLQLDYDLVVVDTPPGAHAEDLLGAPSRIATLVDSGAAAVLRAPASVLGGSRIANTALRTILAALERWIGRGLVANLSDFASAFEPLLAGFADRAREVDQVLRAADTAIVVVTTAEPGVVATTTALTTGIEGRGMVIAGIVANQIEKLPRAKNPGRLRCNPRLREKLRENYTALEDRARRDARAVRTVGNRLAPVLAVIPTLSEPVASLSQLAEIAELLTAQLRRR